MTNLDIIVLLVVVALIFQRLWRVLGTRPEEEPRKVRMSRESAEKLCNILRAEAERKIKEFEKKEEEAEELKPLEDAPANETEAALRQIPGFNRDAFINGAKKAFQVITEAFNNADAEALKMLVSQTVYKKLREVIRQRQEEQMTAETEFICFDKAEIIHAKIVRNKAEISVEFVTEQINVLRDKDNQVVQGDENYIQTITDVWTFERPLDAKTPNWVLISTRK